MPVVIETIEDEFSYMKLIVGGDPGAGKTRWASTWPNVFYIDCEGRLLSVRDRRVRRGVVKSQADLDELIAKLKQPPAVREKFFGGPVETVVFDTVDDFARIIMKERLTAERHDSMQQADWGYLADQLADYVRELRNLDDVHVLFNLHLKREVIDSDNGRSIVTPQLSGKMQSEIFNFVDIAVLLERTVAATPKGEKLTYALKTFPTKECEWIKDHSGAIPNNFEINFNDDYVRLATAVFGEAPPPVMSALELAEQVFDKNKDELAALADTLEADEKAAAEAEAAEKVAAKAAKKAEADKVKAQMEAMRKGEDPTKVSAESDAGSEPEGESAEQVAAEAKAKEEAAKLAAAEAEKLEAEKLEAEKAAKAEAAAEKKAKAEAVEKEKAEAAQAAERAEAEAAAKAREAKQAEAEAQKEAEVDEHAERTGHGDDEVAEVEGKDAVAMVAEAFEGTEQVVDEADAPVPPDGVDPATGEVLNPDSTPEPDAVAEDATEPAAAADEATEADPEDESWNCAVCEVLIENEDVAQLSYIRFQEHLCPEHFAERKKKKKP